MGCDLVVYHTGIGDSPVGEIIDAVFEIDNGLITANGRVVEDEIVIV
jgi:hypothetical protein